MIKKDLYLIMNNRKLFYIVFVVYLFMSFVSNQDYTLFIPFILLMMFLSSFSYDEFNNWNGYGAVLPHGRENIVKGKYVTALILLALSTVISLLLSLTVGAFKNSLDLSFSITTVVGIDSVLLLLISILFPVIFKFGYEKGRIALFIVSFGISGIVILLGRVLKIRIPVSAVTFFVKYGLYLAAAIMIVILYGSYRLSRKIFLNKEL